MVEARALSLVNTVGRTAKGAVTVAQRRGLSYYLYLLHGVALPRVLYRYAWGPAAPRPVQRVFEGVGRLVTSTPTRTQLLELGLVASSPQAGSPAGRALEEVEALMDRAHAAGVTGLDGAFDRLVRTADGTLRFAGLPAARRHGGRGPFYLSARDRDRRAFNRTFGGTLLTEEEARRALRLLKANVPPGYRDYAPIDFGGGLGIGRIASTDSGTGRWEFFNGAIVAPLVAGKRVLDLGSNNGSLPLMMLRAGARQVVAIEGTPEIAEFARLNARILAWRDVARYDMRVITDDMRVFLARDLGRFDVVTAFCSLYYLPEEDMARVIARAASMGATLVLQANEAIGNGLPGRTRDLHRLMRENGYPDVEVHAPRGFARPLLVGREPSAAPRAGVV
jgi:SAM-dependent methyltransferase